MRIPEAGSNLAAAATVVAAIAEGNTAVAVGADMTGHIDPSQVCCLSCRACSIAGHNNSEDNSCHTAERSVAYRHVGDATIFAAVPSWEKSRAESWVVSLF